MIRDMSSMLLRANGPQMPSGVAVNPSSNVGLPGLGNNLQDELDEQLRQRRKRISAGLPYSPESDAGLASDMIFGSTK